MDDYEKAQRVLRWPLREAFLCVIEKMKAQALEAYRHDMTIWAAIAPHSKKVPDQPKFPEILKK